MTTQQAGRIENARRVFARAGRPLRTGEALSAGIHPETLYGMRDSGILEQITRGVYRLADLPANLPAGILLHSASRKILSTSLLNSCLPPWGRRPPTAAFHLGAYPAIAGTILSCQ